MKTLTATLETRKISTLKIAMSAVLLFGAMTLTLTKAHAVSASVQVSCLGDYLSYCSQHAVGSQALRQGMSAAGPKLSDRCVNALISAGEVSKAEVARRAATYKK